MKRLAVVIALIAALTLPLLGASAAPKVCPRDGYTSKCPPWGPIYRFP